MSRLVSPARGRASRGRPARCPLTRTFLSLPRRTGGRALIFRAETPRGRGWVDESLHPGIGLRLPCKRSSWPDSAFRWILRQAPLRGLRCGCFRPRGTREFQGSSRLRLLLPGPQWVGFCPPSRHYPSVSIPCSRGRNVLKCLDPVCFTHQSHAREAEMQSVGPLGRTVTSIPCSRGRNFVRLRWIRQGVNQSHAREAEIVHETRTAGETPSIPCSRGRNCKMPRRKHSARASIPCSRGRNPKRD